MDLNWSSQYPPFYQEHAAYISSNTFISSYFLTNMFVSLQLEQPLLGLHYLYHKIATSYICKATIITSFLLQKFESSWNSFVIYNFKK